MDERKWKCGSGRGGQTVEMWRRQWMKDNGNVVAAMDKNTGNVVVTVV